MVKFENECVGCERCGFCGAKRVPHFYCDECGEEIDYEEAGNMSEYDEYHYCYHCHAILNGEDEEEAEE